MRELARRPITLRPDRFQELLRGLEVSGRTLVAEGGERVIKVSPDAEGSRPDPVAEECAVLAGLPLAWRIVMNSRSSVVLALPTGATDSA